MNDCCCPICRPMPLLRVLARLRQDELTGSPLLDAVRSQIALRTTRRPSTGPVVRIKPTKGPDHA